MNIWTKGLIFGVIVCGVLPVSAGIDWEQILKPRNLVWKDKDFSDDWENVGFIGDGQQGASILIDTVNSNDLRLLLSRYDIVEYPEKGYWPRVFAGNVILKSEGHVLSLRNAVCVRWAGRSLDLSGGTLPRKPPSWGRRYS